VSEGCRNCYAERLAARMSGPGQWGEGFAGWSPSRRQPGRRPHWTGLVELVHKMLTLPLRWRRPRLVFVNSMSDLFHEALPDHELDQVFAVMALARRHTFQILTKRPARMVAYLDRLAHSIAPLEQAARLVGHTFAYEGRSLLPWPIPNVWLGVSVEDQQTADQRIPFLLETPAFLRFVSYEPALGPVDFRSYLDRLNWIIVGGESGPGARPFDVAWARTVIRQSRAVGASCFVKQLGARPYDGEPQADGLGLSVGGIKLDLESAKGGIPDEWPEDLRVRELPPL
jgi:protein gp37